MILSFVFSLILGFILIPYFKKHNDYQRYSIYQKSKDKTPTMGGFIFILSTLITMLILWIFKGIKISNAYITVLITFIGYFIIV